jgi:(Z)-2-((N-methylformamido)methylene)-5-hydroxybutyrolactone dehydrogenase
MHGLAHCHACVLDQQMFGGDVTATATGASRRYSPYIGGGYVDAETDRYLPSINPTDGMTLYEFAASTDADVDRAVRSARRALVDPAWRDMSPGARGRLMRGIAARIRELGDSIAQLESRDNGKLIRELRAQHLGLPDLFEYFAGWPDKFAGELVPRPVSTLNYLVPEPVGVVAAIVPWNSPVQIACVKLAPALAAGNTIVIKPSEHATAGVLEFVAALEDVGLPPGVINVVTGLGGETGAALAAHPGVDLISFTGGNVGGRAVAAAAARRPIRTLLELGGKSPNIVFPDADLDRAAVGVIAGIFAAAGQTCVAGSRCFLHRDVHDEMLDRVVDRARRIRIGDPLDDATELGPVAFEAHLERILDMIESGRADGAEVVHGGRRASDGPLARGFFVEPTIFAGVRNDMRVARDEVFGPVLTVLPFSDEDEVVEAANDSAFGLAAGVWTRDLARAHRMARRLDAGTVWINTYRAMSPESPFGGFKGSGYGKDGGAAVLREYTRSKSVWVDLDEGPSRDPFVIQK